VAADERLYRELGDGTVEIQIQDEGARSISITRRPKCWRPCSNYQAAIRRPRRGGRHPGLCRPRQRPRRPGKMTMQRRSENAKTPFERRRNFERARHEPCHYDSIASDVTVYSAMMSSVTAPNLCCGRFNADSRARDQIMSARSGSVPAPAVSRRRRHDRRCQDRRQWAVRPGDPATQRRAGNPFQIRLEANLAAGALRRARTTRTIRSPAASVAGKVRRALVPEGADAAHRPPLRAVLDQSVVAN
jgi:hypothetical protein